MIARWDAVAACNEASAALRRMAIALRALADADHTEREECRQHADEAEWSAVAVDDWRQAIKAKITMGTTT